MQRNLKKILITVLVVMGLWLPTVQAEEADTLLRWKNGDMLPGQMNGSSSGAIHWGSPYFLDDLVLDISVLDSIAFPKSSVLTTETFRVDAVSGDVWVADLIDSDADTFLFSSKRHGQFRVKRAAVRSLEHRNHSNLLFDGSQLTNWKSPKTKKDIDDPLLLAFHEPASDWHRNNEGHPQTTRNTAKLFHAFKWPKYFEIDLELAFTGPPPSFVFAFGKDLYQALRLEVWSDKLVAVQGTLFQPVLTIQPEQHNLHLRLTYNESTGVLRVFDFTGNLLLRLEGVKPTVKEPGLYIKNRGKGLTVQALKVYHQPTAEPIAQQVDFSKPRVYMMNGQIVQGELFAQKDSTYVLDTDGTRQDIDPQQISRVVQPVLPSTALDVEAGLPNSYIKYPDEVVLHGKIIQVNSERVILQTAFADNPITCSLAGASRLHFDTNPKTNRTIQNTDMLFHTTGNLRGRVLFTQNRGILSIQWESLGALKPVRLANNRAAHIRRFLQPTSKASRHFDTTQFPHALHLQTGETFPCHITTYDGKTIRFQSPFISAQHLDSANMKALEFSDRTHAPGIDRTQSATDFDSLRVRYRENGFKEIKMQRVGQDKDENVRFLINADDAKKFDAKKLEEGQLVLTIIGKDGIEKVKERNPEREWMEMEDDTWIGLIATQPAPKKDKSYSKLERALTVPRFNQDNPPNHILVAKTGDMKRGKFLDFQAQTIQFDSRLRKFSVPIDRVARVVDVSDNTLQSSVVGKDGSDKQEPLLLKAESRKPKAIQSEVRVTLTDGSMLIFEPLEVKDGKLIGRSSVYGEVSVPVSSIEYLYFGEKAKSFKAAFEKWNIRPAKEPAYEDSP